MKLFNRGKSEDGAPEGAPAPAPAPAAPAPAGHQGAPQETPAGGQSAAPGDAGGDEGMPQDLQVVLDNSLKDLNEKLSKLAASVEDVTEERGAVDDKIGKMEERMRKLAVLTEMVSNQYNPFLGDGSKPKNHAVPSDEDEDAPPEPPAVPPMDLPPLPEAPPVEEPPEFPAPALEAPPAPPVPPVAEVADDEADDLEMEPAPPAPKREPMEGAPHLDRVSNTFENHLLMMAWADVLLKHTDRLAVNDLLRYYEEIGWISGRVRQQLLGYTSGLRYEPVDPEADDANWRGNLELHERSLLFIEKLRGHGVNQENLAALKRDIDRILGSRRRGP